MTWAFDSGLPKPIRTLVRNAVLAKLAPLAKPTGFLEALVPLGYDIAGPHDDHNIDMLVEELHGRSPAIAVALCDCHDSPAGAPGFSKGALVVELYFVSSHLRDMTDGRVAGDPVAAASDAADPGLEVIMQLAWQLLFNAPMVLDDTKVDSKQRAQPLIRVSETPIGSMKDFTLWKQKYTTQITLDVNLYRDVIQQLLSAHTTLIPTGDEPESLHMAEDTDVGP